MNFSSWSVCYKGVSSSLFKSGTRPPDLLKCSLDGVSGFSPVKGVPNFMSRSSFVASFSEGGRDAFLGNGAKSSVHGLTGRSGNEKLSGSDNVCLCKADCPIHGEREPRVWDSGLSRLAGGLRVGYVLCDKWARFLCWRGWRRTSPRGLCEEVMVSGPRWDTPCWKGDRLVWSNPINRRNLKGYQCPVSVAWSNYECSLPPGCMLVHRRVTTPFY